MAVFESTAMTNICFIFARTTILGFTAINISSIYSFTLYVLYKRFFLSIHNEHTIEYKSINPAYSVMIVCFSLITSSEVSISLGCTIKRKATAERPRGILMEIKLIL